MKSEGWQLARAYCYRILSQEMIALIHFFSKVALPNRMGGMGGAMSEGRKENSQETFALVIQVNFDGGLDEQ